LVLRWCATGRTNINRYATGPSGGRASRRPGAPKIAERRKRATDLALLEERRLTLALAAQYGEDRVNAPEPPWLSKRTRKHPAPLRLPMR
jgi:hypothetical protein